MSTHKANNFAADRTLTHYITTVEFIAANTKPNSAPVLDDDLDHNVIKFRVLAEGFIHESIKAGARQPEEKHIITSATLEEHKKLKRTD